MRRISIGLLIGAILGGGLTWFGLALTSKKTTLSRLSPQETLRASLVEREFSSVDRSIELRLEDLAQGETITILRPSNEGSPAGSERLIWSKDGEWLLLVGRHFFVKDDLFLDNGDQLFFLYHPASRKGWINSHESRDWPPLKSSAIENLEFTEPIRLKPR